MRLSEYYNQNFRQDLMDVLANAKSVHPHAEVSLQPRTVSRENPTVARWPEERRLLFASALFLTVLVDQVCYTHFRDAYPTFRRLTQYPKWRGDCPGACGYHIHPEVIFRVVGQLPGPAADIEELALPLLPDDLFATMKNEIVDFVQNHLPGTDPEEFWGRCDAEIPIHFRLLYLASRRRE
jgi:hypothetical protein